MFGAPGLINEAILACSPVHVEPVHDPIDDEKYRKNIVGYTAQVTAGVWVGTFHALARTALVTAVWYLFPLTRFVAVPAVIVAVYAVTIIVLEVRWRRIDRA